MKKEAATTTTDPKAANLKVRSDDGDHYFLTLYITGTTPGSARAAINIRKLCDEYLEGRYTLTVVDILEDPAAAKREQLIAAPTLIKHLPLPIRRFIGDLSETGRVIAGLDLQRG